MTDDSAIAQDRFGPLGAVITFRRQEQLDALLTDDDLATLRHLLRKGIPENTLRALASDLAYLEAWCQAATGDPLPWPAQEALALKFIAHHLFDPAEQGRDPTHGMPPEIERMLKGQGVLKVGGPHAPATVQRRLSSWASIHRWRGLDSATSAPRVRTAIKLAVKAANRRPRRKSERAIVRTVLIDALARCYDRTIAGRRDRALLLVAFASGGRRRRRPAVAAKPLALSIGPAADLAIHSARPARNRLWFRLTPGRLLAAMARSGWRGALEKELFGKSDLVKGSRTPAARAVPHTQASEKP